MSAPSNDRVAAALGLSSSLSQRRPSADFASTAFRQDTEVVAADIPVASTSALSDAEIAEVNVRLADATPQAILEWAITRLGRGLYQTTAFGLTGLVALDMISKISEQRAPQGHGPSPHLVPLIFLDTLYHFAETTHLARRAQRRYGADLIWVKPPGVSTVEEFEEKYGHDLWKNDEDSYDYLVKVEPARRIYAERGVTAVITGRRRSQGADRAAIPIVEKDETGLLKINPLATWSFKQTRAYIDEHNVPYNELLDRGYTSVGDWHSTKPPTGVKSDGIEGNAERSGRWSDKAGAKTECGLHKDYFKMKAAFAKKQREAEFAKRDTDNAPIDLAAKTDALAL